MTCLLATTQHAIAQAPDWTLTKTPNPATYTAAGQTITYTYVIADNTGSVGTLVGLTDDKVAPANISCPSNTVPANGTLTCAGTYTTTNTDLTNGSVTNTATATGVSCGGDCDILVQAQATITFTPQPSWTLTKTPTPSTYTAAGQTINYSYLLTNTGNVSIASISLSDNKVATVACPATTLAVGANMTCTGSYVTKTPDVTAGSVTNTATATGTPSQGSLANATAQATITFQAQPSWTLTKTPTPTTYSAAGQTINYSYLLTNTGNVSISAISLSDNKIATVNCPATTLAVGANMTCTGSYVTTNADVTAGSVTNTATATGTPVQGILANATAQATITFTPQPSWTLTKTPAPTTYSAAGQTINYSYLLTNTGNVSISAISLSDNRIASVNCPATTLAVGANMTCTGSYVTTNADVRHGSVTNRATATGTPASGSLPNVTARATVTFVGLPTGSITIVKTANGGNATFTFASTGTGVARFMLTTAGGTASRTFSGLAPGRYRFTEINLPRRWELRRLNCTGDTGGRPTTVDLSGRSVSVGLDGGEAIVCTFTNRFSDKADIIDTQNTIRRFLSHRVTLLANNEPDRARFIRRVTGSLWGDSNPGRFNAANDGPFNLSGYSSELSTQMAFATSLSQIVQAYADADREAGNKNLPGSSAMAMATKAPPARPAPRPSFDMWIEAHFSQFRAQVGNTGDDGSFGLVYVGADYLVTSSVLLGALVQFDWMSENSRTTTNSSANGTGWMAGPYLSVRLTPNLFFDTRAAWGTSSNRVNPFGTYEDGFATHRWLAHAKLTGNWRMDNFRITPSVGFTYIEENQHSYVDTLGSLIPSQTVALGRLSFGPEFARRYIGANGTIYEPQISITGQWDAVKPDAVLVGGIPVPTDSLFARVQGGIMARWPSGFAVRAVASYDGLGSDNFSSIGGRLWLNIPFH